MRNLKNIVKGATDPRSDQQLICQHQQKHKLRIYSPSKIMGQYFVPKFWNHMIMRQYQIGVQFESREKTNSGDFWTQTGP